MYIYILSGIVPVSNLFLSDVFGFLLLCFDFFSEARKTSFDAQVFFLDLNSKILIS